MIFFGYLLMRRYLVVCMVIFTMMPNLDGKWLQARPALLAGGCGQRTAAAVTFSVLSIRAVVRAMAARTPLMAWRWASRFDLESGSLCGA